MKISLIDRINLTNNAIMMIDESYMMKLHEKMFFDFDCRKKDDTYILDDKAVIPITGVLTNKDENLSYCTSYQKIMELTENYLSNNKVKEIVYHFDTGGGVAAGLAELSDFITDLKKNRRVTSMISNAMSAGYHIASQAHNIIATKSASIGSIGVRAVHQDASKMYEKFGLVHTVVKSGEYKDQYSPYRAMTQDEEARMQVQCDAIYDDFINLVATNRGIKPEVVRDTKADVFSAEQALSIGLIDKIENSNIFFKSSQSKSRKGKKMESLKCDASLEDAKAFVSMHFPNLLPKANSEQELQEARETAATEERERIQACLSIKGYENSNLARKLAFEVGKTKADVSLALLESDADDRQDYLDQSEQNATEPVPSDRTTTLDDKPKPTVDSISARAEKMMSDNPDMDPAEVYLKIQEEMKGN